MQLPASMLTSTCQVLERVAGAPGALGSVTYTWQPQGTLPCAHFPAGTKVTQIAQLRGVKVSREVYLERTALNPQTHRVALDGVPYQITLVSDWDGFTVLGVVTP